MAERAIRVLVVDDSAFARKVIREALEGKPGIEVVGTARDGLDALEKITELTPDVITLDLLMPHLDGLGVLKALASQPNPPRALVVSTMDDQSDLVLACLEAGAVDFVHKPTSLATERLYEISEEVATRVRTAYGARPPFHRSLSAPSAGDSASAILPPRLGSGTLVVIGTSTGGPAALAHLMAALPADFPAPIAIALHIPEGYTEALAHRLDQASPLQVLEAEDGMALRPGRVVLARAGRHLKFVGSGPECVAALDLSPFETPHRPSVDVLFTSAAAAWGKDVLAVVLTGMGSDGLEGARRVREAGGAVVTEHASSCVIYGMPRVVDEAGLSQAQVSLGDLAAALTRMVSG